MRTVINSSLIALLIGVLTVACNNNSPESSSIVNPVNSINESIPIVKTTSLIVLGNVQDAGSPQIACKKECCKDLFKKTDENRRVVALGVVDPINDEKYLFEATPDIAQQLKYLKQFSGEKSGEIAGGVFLTHAHIGHYTGLMYFGKEAMNADAVPVYSMPKMKQYLQENGPWSQLVENRNILIQELKNEEPLQLSEQLTVIPLLVPHRDEFSETVAYKIEGSKKSALFIPDIDKWEKWDKNIIEEIAKVDYAFLDATFYDGAEINNRDISEIPHPFVIESMEKFKELTEAEKDKIYFIHFNHTNPLLNPESKQSRVVAENGFHIARLGDRFEL